MRYLVDEEGWFRRSLLPGEAYPGTDFPADGCFVEDGMLYAKHPTLDPRASAAGRAWWRLLRILGRDAR